MGPCDFNPATLSFAGAPVDQARCLMRGMDRTRNLTAALPALPPALASRIGTATGLPRRTALASYLASRPDLDAEFGAYLAAPLSRANDNDPEDTVARYFVIHDTSGPRYGHRPFPDDINTTSRFNNLRNFECDDGWGKAHVVVNRAGTMLLDHDFQIPWRETKFEQAANFAGALKGLFVHIELIQPRRSASGHGSYNDAQSPDPAFTVVQYDRLALLYAIASVRRGNWLIPAFHAAIDAGIPNGHDDPLNFDIGSFSESVDRIVEILTTPAELQAAIEAEALNYQAESATTPPDQPDDGARSAPPAHLAHADPGQLDAGQVDGEGAAARDQGNTSEPKPRKLKTSDPETRVAESCHQARLAKRRRLGRCRIGATARHDHGRGRKAHEASSKANSV
jgi:hypothetical protein